MRLSAYREIKDDLAIRAAVLKAAIVDTFNQDTAYISENYSSIFSTITYTLSFALFIKVIYGNVDSIAGYNEDQMLFFLFMSQFSFYVQYTFYDLNIETISYMVNTGELDLWLSKPIPALFYLSFRRISILRIIREVIPALFFLALMISWGNLDFTIQSIVSGSIIFLLGQVALYCMSIFACIPVFWLGRNGQIYHMSRILQWLGRKEVPFEGFPQSLKLIFTSFIPVIISAGLATSVFLGKTDSRPAILYTSIVVLFLIVLKSLAWDKAMKAYSSASS